MYQNSNCDCLLKIGLSFDYGEPNMSASGGNAAAAAFSSCVPSIHGTPCWIGSRVQQANQSRSALVQGAAEETQVEPFPCQAEPLTVVQLV